MYNIQGRTTIQIILSVLISSALFTTLFAKDIATLAVELDLYAGTKASIQWERIFSSQRRMQKYNLDKLSKELRNDLKSYLIKHAADSEQPMVPGL